MYPRFFPSFFNHSKVVLFLALCLLFGLSCASKSGSEKSEDLSKNSSKRITASSNINDDNVKKSAVSQSKRALGNREASYEWVSANGWTGGRFSVPPNFAPDLDFTGLEVLRFHPDFYKNNAAGSWTYAFVLVVDQIEMPTTEQLKKELEVYFLGLGRNLGKRKNPALDPATIEAVAVGTWTADVDGKSKHLFRVQAYDSFNVGKSQPLFVEVTTSLCAGGARRALIFLLSPQARPHAVWQELDREPEVIRCR